MNRMTLDDGTWFDADEATMWDEDRYWDGSNYISQATGCQWQHERLYRTAKGTYVLHSWSQVEKEKPTTVAITDERAHRWLIKNDHGDSMPKEAAAELEV